MRKSVLVIFSAVLFLSTISSSTLAATPFPSPSPIKNNASFKESTKNQNEEIMLRISAVRRERIRNYFNKMISRIEAVVDRLEVLITNIESRVEIISTNDSEIDVTPVEIELSNAKDLLSTVDSDVILLKSEIENVILSDDPKANFVTVKDMISEIKNNLKEVHNILVQVIGDIRGLRIGNTNNLNEE